MQTHFANQLSDYFLQLSDMQFIIASHFLEVKIGLEKDLIFIWDSFVLFLLYTCFFFPKLRQMSNLLVNTEFHFKIYDQNSYFFFKYCFQVCRIAYEIMQTFHPDASSFFSSLDDIYYYGGQNAHNQRARFPHTPRR